MSFFTHAVQTRLGQENQLIRIEALVDWQPIKEKLACIYKNEYQATAGVRPYSSLSMFKAILLQSWHSLSDPKLEEALKVRIDFMLFTGMGVEDEIPDETTICRFRNRLLKKGLDQELFEEINRQLERQGLKVEKATGAVIDASVIKSAARPSRCIDIAVDRNEEAIPEIVFTDTSDEKAQVDIDVNTNIDTNTGDTATKTGCCEVRESVDPDAKWLKKGNRCYFGYKLFLAADDKDGYATGIDITPANRSETRHFAEFIEKIPCKKGMRIYGDKAYASKENRELLQSKKIKDGIMEKAFRGSPLTNRQKQKNRLISRRRYVVERGYGTMKRILKFERASYMGIAKVKGQALRKAICFNLLKAINKIKVYDWLPREWCVQLQLME
jgi:IS5 family transposase